MESVCPNLEFRYEDLPCIVRAIIAGIEQASTDERFERAGVWNGKGPAADAASPTLY